MGFAMSHLARSYVKFLQQAKSTGLVQARNMSAGHSADGWKMWRNCFLFVGIPVIVLGHVNLLECLMGLSTKLLHSFLTTISALGPRSFPGEMATIPLSTIHMLMPCPMATKSTTK